MKKNSYTTGELATRLKASIEGSDQVVLNSVSDLKNAHSGQISFLSHPKYEKQIYSTQASAVLVAKNFKAKQGIDPILLRVENINIAKSELLHLFEKERKVQQGISKLSFISPSAKVDSSCTIGHFTVVKENAQIGHGTELKDQVWIGENVIIGQNCILNSGVKIYHDTIIGDNVIIHSNAVVGSDGFGFTPDEKGVFRKIPQLGKVVIGNNVEIGSNTVIDRATMGETIIEDGVKLDNLVQIAHNVHVKANTVMAAQSGIAGSSTVGRNCFIGGQVAIIGHIEVADGAQVQGQSGIAGSVKQKNAKLYGTPAIEFGKYLKSYALFKKLPEMYESIQRIKRYLKSQNNEQEGQDF